MKSANIRLPPAHDDYYHEVVKGDMFVLKIIGDATVARIDLIVTISANH